MKEEKNILLEQMKVSQTQWQHQLLQAQEQQQSGMPHQQIFSMMQQQQSQLLASLLKSKEVILHLLIFKMN